MRRGELKKSMGLGTGAEKAVVVILVLAAVGSLAILIGVSLASVLSKEPIKYELAERYAWEPEHPTAFKRVPYLRRASGEVKTEDITVVTQVSADRFHRLKDLV